MPMPLAEPAHVTDQNDLIFFGGVTVKGHVPAKGHCRGSRSLFTREVMTLSLDLEKRESKYECDAEVTLPRETGGACAARDGATGHVYVTGGRNATR